MKISYIVHTLCQTIKIDYCDVMKKTCKCSNILYFYYSAQINTVDCPKISVIEKKNSDSVNII